MVALGRHNDVAQTAFSGVSCSMAASLRSRYFYENPLRVNGDSWSYFTVFPFSKGSFFAHTDGVRLPVNATVIERRAVSQSSIRASPRLAKCPCGCFEKRWLPHLITSSLSCPSTARAHHRRPFRVGSSTLMRISSVSWLRRPRESSFRDTATASSDWRRLPRSRCPVYRLQVGDPPIPTSVRRNA